MIDDPKWSFANAPPDGWEELLVRHGGGFFHSPAALSASFPEGEPLFARWTQGTSTRAVALGVARHCRLPPSKSHVYFAALPVLADVPGGFVSNERGSESARRKRTMKEVLATLVEALERRRAVEIVMDSYGAGGVVPKVGRALAKSKRLEHVVALDRDLGEILASFGTTHRRHIRRGERGGWTMRLLEFDCGKKVLHDVIQQASRRAAERGHRFSAGWLRPAAREDFADLARPWGQATAAAYDGGALLAAILVGWGNGRAYYLRGGSTTLGYRNGAATWLHWTMMRLLSEHGFGRYNLGGTPESASDPTAPSRGLQRFKEHFGGRAVRCRGARWDLHPGHLAAHRVAAFLARKG